MKRRWADRIVATVTISIFVAALVVLYDQFRSVSLHELLAALAAMPRSQIAAAIGLTAASYLLLTGYDFLALCYVRRRLRFRDVLFASFTAFAFSNNIGVQLLSGGSMRYRIYSNFGVGGVDILSIIIFCTLAYALGVMTIAGTVFLLEPAAIAAALHLPRSLVSIAGVALLALSAFYLVVAAKWRRPIGFGRFRLQPPSLALAITQVALASVDAVLASSVFYVLLPVAPELGFQSYLGIYMIAATLSVVSLVPGGLGVFETAITLMTVPPSKAAALSAFLAYRMIYFVTPFVIAIIGFSLHEMRRKFDGRRPIAGRVESLTPPRWLRSRS